VKVTILVMLLLCVPSGEVTAQGAFDARIRELMQQFSHEPTVREVQRAAARHARVNPGAYHHWLSASSWAHALPERVKGEVQHLARDEKDVRTTSSTNSLSELLALDAHLRLELEVQWDLSKLIFNPDKLKASKEIANLVELREDILTTVNKLYFSRRRVQIEQLLNPPQNLRHAVNVTLNINSLTADLDALTGGWLSREIKRRAKRAASKLKRRKKATKAPKLPTPLPAPTTP
jgi:hypothetical protein